MRDFFHPLRTNFCPLRHEIPRLGNAWDRPKLALAFYFDRHGGSSNVWWSLCHRKGGEITTPKPNTLTVDRNATWEVRCRDRTGHAGTIRKGNLIGASRSVKCWWIIFPSSYQCFLRNNLYYHFLLRIRPGDGHRKARERPTKPNVNAPQNQTCVIFFWSLEMTVFPTYLTHKGDVSLWDSCENIHFNQLDRCRLEKPRL